MADLLSSKGGACLADCQSLDFGFNQSDSHSHLKTWFPLKWEYLLCISELHWDVNILLWVTVGEFGNFVV